ncbi:10409_t:CDS:2 [Funneliformis caledonium]|uniref:10409_t:CDS:1 n=1 Tax=Funneliformis caledonium TaxID=1117310 RepID=A0A9N8V3J2_9GLOM|nr:10409_t:CDS:2 [Funneliformis caledonium]
MYYGTTSKKVAKHQPTLEKSSNSTTDPLISKNVPPPHAPQQKKTKHGNNFKSLAIYLYNLYYTHLHFNRLVFIVQHNNLNVQEQIVLREELKRKGAILTAVRGSIFGSVIRQSIYSNLLPLVVGPTCLIGSNVGDDENPRLVADILNIISNNKKLVLVGGKMDRSLLDLEGFQRVAKLPGLKHLQSELIGLLNSPSSRIVELLNRNAQDLVFTLETHKNNLGEPNSGEK